MRREELLEELIRYVASDLLDGQQAGLDGSSPLLEWGVIDSLSMVSLLAFIERRFHIRIPDEAVKPEHFQDLNTLSTFLADLPAEAAIDMTAPIRALEPHGVRRRWRDLRPMGTLHLFHLARPPPPLVIVPALGNPASSWA